ncbi:hypothetical protein AVEN_255187-1 [Araneus ventricosus]|uniref:Uncharacterized protein n=1 Tax=Araneus ventricosus TaxID=182803 RepID=A0A4Y2B9L0_ARAVE|nr:hypothetical protein AVEN_255187-1 [Araneus ventricosus]
MYVLSGIPLDSIESASHFPGNTSGVRKRGTQLEESVLVCQLNAKFYTHYLSNLTNPHSSVTSHYLMDVFNDILSCNIKRGSWAFSVTCAHMTASLLNHLKTVRIEAEESP